MSEWKLVQEETYPFHKQKKLSKKYKELVSNVLINLETYRQALNLGVNPEQAKRTLAFVHEEKKGLIAIDQRPPVGGPQLRLYIFSNLTTKTIHILMIGDKNTQSADISRCHNIIGDIL